MKTVPDWPFQGIPLPTKIVASNNTAQNLPTAYMGTAATRITAKVKGKVAAAKGCWCFVRANTIRVSFGGADPAQLATSIGMDFVAGSSFWIGSYEYVNTMRFVSAVPDTHGYLVMSPEV